MKYTNIPLAQNVVAHCKTYGIRHVVISPGSRNAPLTIGFTHDPYFKCYSIVDERCAAFFAMGIAQQISEPVVLVCTSGSALLNYYPAISEAFFSRIPLIVISADRPEHLIGIGDGQTIYQKNVFDNHIFYSANLRSEDGKGAVSFNSQEIEMAMNESIRCSGPVHMNVPLSEPLYGMTDQVLIGPIQKKHELAENHSDDDQVMRFKELWKETDRKMVLIGVLKPDSLSPTILRFLAEDPSVIVFTETTSNVHNEYFFPSIDKIIAPLDENAFIELQPRLLITLGGMIISKKIKRFLRTYQPEEHWHIGPFDANDTFFRLTQAVKTDADHFLSAVFKNLGISKNSDYRTPWLRLKAERAIRHDMYMREIPYSDLMVFDRLLRYLDKELLLQLSNSSTIRYAQLFDWDPLVQMYCNRGTSGIDGSTSTAIGAACVNPQKPSLLITGDLSFFYDSNALWNNYIPKDFKILLINNEGGGIFRILPGHKNTDNFDRFFETRHGLTARYLCKMYNFKYFEVHNDNQLDDQLELFFNHSGQPALIEIITPARTNDGVLLNYFEFMK